MRLGLGLALIPAVAGEHPIQKLVKVLEDSAAELAADKEAMLKQSDAKQCWCNENRKEKNTRIEANEAKLATLNAETSALQKAIASGKTKKAELETNLEEAKTEHKETQDELQKKTKEYMEETAELTENVQSVAGALVVLKKHFEGNLKTPEKVLMQVRAMLNKVNFADLPGTSLDIQKTQAIALLQDGSSSKSSIAEVVGTLQQMQENFEQMLKEKENEWGNERARLAELLAARKSTMDSLQKELESVSTKLAEDVNKFKIAKRKIAAAKAQVESDRKFLADMEPACKEDMDERNRREKLMDEENKTIIEVIKILTSDEMFKVSHGAFKTDKKATSFLQRGATTAVERALGSLKRAAVPQARQIALLATEAGPNNAFDKVLEYIAKLTVDLKAKKKANVDQKAVCEEELRTNQGNTIDIQTQINTHNSKIEMAKGSISSLEKSVKELTDDMEQNQISLAEMTQNRIKESTSFQQFVGDNTITIEILLKAEAKLQAMYGEALLQRPSPGGLKKDGYQATRGSGVLALLQDVRKDAEANIKQAVADEQTKHTEHVTLFNELTGEYLSNKANLVQTQGQLADAHKTLLQHEQDLKDGLSMMQDLLEEAQQLAKSCNFFLNNFEAQQAAIDQEVAGLTEAANILRGAQ